MGWWKVWIQIKDENIRSKDDRNDLNGLNGTYFCDNHKGMQIKTSFFCVCPREQGKWRLLSLLLAFIQHAELSTPTTASPCLTWFRLDKPSPIPNGPIETLNLPLKRSEVHFCVGIQQRQARNGRKQEQMEEGLCRFFENFKQFFIKVLSWGQIWEFVDKVLNFITV